MDEIRYPPFVEHPIGSVAHVEGEHPLHVTSDGADKQWGHSNAGKGVRVGVVDTFPDVRHKELEDSIKDAKDFIGEGTTPSNPHGTHVASTIAGKTVGAAPEAELYCAGVLGKNGSGSLQAVADGIRWCVDQGCHLINTSLGSPNGHPVLQAACEYAMRNKCVIIAATGNEFASRVSFPAGYNQMCIACGAVTYDKEHANFSNKGPSVDSVHYGVEVLAAIPGGGYQAYSGTSMATPNLCARIALRMSTELKHLGKITTNSVVALQDFASCCFEDLGSAGVDRTFGWGFPTLSKLLHKGINGDLPTSGETYFHAYVDGCAGRYVFVPD